MSTTQLEQPEPPNGQKQSDSAQDHSMHVLTPAEWAREHLKSAPSRSPEWAARVARIYGLEVGD